MASELFNSTKKIKYLNKVAIRKTKLIKLPDDFQPTIASPIDETAVEETAVEEPAVATAYEDENPTL